MKTADWLLCGWMMSAGAVASAADSAVLSGGETTSHNTGQNAFAQPLANLSRAHRREFTVGNSFFNQNWTQAPGQPDSRDGLGPFFNTRSCSSCHLFDGRGSPPEAGALMTGLLFRLGTAQTSQIPIYGGQLAPRALPGLKPEGNVTITWKDKPVTLADGTIITLREPSYSPKDWAYGEPPSDLALSPRVAPAVFGLGLLEALAESEIMAREDPEDRDKNGISGKAARLTGEQGKSLLGRFGWKAAMPTLRAQTVRALAEDMGLTTSDHPQENTTEELKPKVTAYPSGGSPEVSDKILDRLTSYLRALAPPARRLVGDAQTEKGSQLFAGLGCAQCHVPEMRTGDFPDFPELQHQTIRPYTDLLLHDMGPDLADHRPEGAATGSEWRTPPLWGLGLLQTVNKHQLLLHDGRARGPEEAILWHGGEAEMARKAYSALGKEDRAAVLAFLNSL